MLFAEKFRDAYGHLNREIRKRIQARSLQTDSEPRDFIEGYLKAVKADPKLEDRSTQITRDFFQVWGVGVGEGVAEVWSKGTGGGTG